MTKSKRTFAEMFAAAQGRQGDTGLIDELCEKYTMIEIIYEMKKYEEETKEPEPVPEPVPEKKEPEKKEAIPEPEKKEAIPEPEKKEAIVSDFWSRLSSSDD